MTQKFRIIYKDKIKSNLQLYMHKNIKANSNYIYISQYKIIIFNKFIYLPENIVRILLKKKDP